MTADKTNKFIWWRPVLAYVALMSLIAAIYFVLAKIRPPSTEPVTPSHSLKIRAELARVWSADDLSSEPSLWNWDIGGTLTKLKKSPSQSGFRITDKTGERQIFQVDFHGASYALQASDDDQFTWGLTELSRRRK